MTMRQMKLGLVVAACLIGGIAASADSLKYTGYSDWYAANLRWKIPGYMGGVEQSEDNIVAGYYKYSINGGATFNSFCLDFFDKADEGPHTYAATALEKAPLTQAISVGMGSDAALTIQKRWTAFYGKTDNKYSVGDLQVAIWKTVAAGLGGYLKVTDTTRDAAAQALINYVKNNEVAPASLFAWSNAEGPGKYQDYIGVPDGGVTLVLLGMSMGGLAFFARRKES